MAERGDMKTDGQAQRRRFLVVYNYGQGGVWAFIWAQSADDILQRFRDLEVVNTWPSWLAGDELSRIEQTMTFDIDDVKPDDWIARMLRPG